MKKTICTLFTLAFAAMSSYGEIGPIIPKNTLQEAMRITLKAANDYTDSKLSPTTDVSTVIRRVDELREDHNNLSNDVDVVKIDVDNASKKADDAKTSADNSVAIAANAEQIATDVNAKTTAISDKVNAIDSKLADYGIVKDQVERNKSDIASMNVSITSMSSKIEANTESIISAQAAIASTRTLVETTKADVNDVRNLADQAISSAAAAQASADAAQATADMANVSANTANQGVAKVTVDVTKLSSDVDTNAKEIKSVDESLKAFKYSTEEGLNEHETSIARNKQGIDDLNSMLSDYPEVKAQVAKGKNDIDELNKRIEENEKFIDEIDSSVKELDQEIKVTNKRLDDAEGNLHSEIADRTEGDEHLGKSIADEWTPGKAYPKGSVVVHDGIRYVAIDNFPVTTTFDPSMWEAESVQEAINNLPKPEPVILSGAGKLYPDYLYEMTFDDTYQDDAAWYYQRYGGAVLQAKFLGKSFKASSDRKLNNIKRNKFLDAPVGMCSSVRRGGEVHRNYDWYYDDAAEFIVRVNKSKNVRFSSIGVASVGTNLTDTIVKMGQYSRYYKCLPGMTLDGINEKGVFAEVNVVPAVGETTWHGTTLNALGAVRYVLDNCELAEEAAWYIANNVYMPIIMRQAGYEFHYMIGDKDNTFIVENGAVHKVGNDTAMTNYRLFSSQDPSTSPCYDRVKVAIYDPYGTGLERAELLAKGYDITSCWFTHAYDTTSAPEFPWPTEFVGTEPELTLSSSDNELRTWAAKHVPHPRTRGDKTWQTVHTTKYDIEDLSFQIAVQETNNWYTIKLFEGGSNVDEGQIRNIAMDVIKNQEFDIEVDTSKRNFGIFEWEIESSKYAGNPCYAMWDKDPVNYPLAWSCTMYAGDTDLTFYMTPSNDVETGKYFFIPKIKELPIEVPPFSDLECKLDMSAYGFGNVIIKAVKDKVAMTEYVEKKALDLKTRIDLRTDDIVNNILPEAIRTFEFPVNISSSNLDIPTWSMRFSGIGDEFKLMWDGNRWIFNLNEPESMSSIYASIDVDKTGALPVFYTALGGTAMGSQIVVDSLDPMVGEYEHTYSNVVHLTLMGEEMNLDLIVNAVREKYARDSEVQTIKSKVSEFNTTYRRIEDDSRYTSEETLSKFKWICESNEGLTKKLNMDSNYLPYKKNDKWMANITNIVVGDVTYEFGNDLHEINENQLLCTFINTSTYDKLEAVAIRSYLPPGQRVEDDRIAWYSEITNFASRASVETGLSEKLNANIYVDGTNVLSTAIENARIEIRNEIKDKLKNLDPEKATTYEIVNALQSIFNN